MSEPSVRYQYWHGKPAVEHSWSAETYNACPCETCAKIKEDWQAGLTRSHTEQTPTWEDRSDMSPN